MAITIYLRSTTTHVGTLGSHGNNDLETTTATTATQSIGANTPRTFVYYSASNWPNLLDWQTGDYTYNIDVTTANANVQLTSLKVSRYDSSLSTEKASGTATPNLTLSTTGLKTGTITFASPNPGNRASDDRLVLTITISKLAGGGTQSAVIDLNGASDSRLDTPLTLPVIRNINEGSVSVSESVATNELYTKPISEGSVSISENLDDTETYVKPISESSISASDSVEGDKILAPTNQVYDIHFVEFPEDAIDEIVAVKQVAGEQVTTSKTHKFDVIGKVTSSKTHKYNIISTVSTTKTHKFNILTALAKSKTHLYNIIGKITATKTHLYNIIGKLTVSKTHKYHLEGRVTTSKTHKYDITGVLETVSTTKTHLFSVLQQITKTKTHKYSVLQQITQTKTHKYNILAKVTQTKTHLFSILQKVTLNRTHKWNILVQVTPSVTKTHKYSILSRVALTRTHKYNIIGRITTSKTHKWNSGGVVRLSRTHKYIVGSGAQLQELGGSTNALIKFPARIRIIDIVSDINNEAIANVEIVPELKNVAIALVAISEFQTSDNRLLTASSLVHKPKILVASGLILPEIIDTIQNVAIAPYIAVEILEPPSKPSIQLLCSCRLQTPKNPYLTASSTIQLKQNDMTIINVASATELVNTTSPHRETQTLAKLRIPHNFKHQVVQVEEIMPQDRAKKLKVLINLLKSDHLFE